MERSGRKLQPSARVKPHFISPPSWQGVLFSAVFSAPPASLETEEVFWTERARYIQTVGRRGGWARCFLGPLMGCGASTDARQGPADISSKEAQPQVPRKKTDESLPTLNHSLPSHPGTLKQPTSAAAASSATVPATTAVAAHPAAFRKSHPASLSSARDASELLSQQEAAALAMQKVMRGNSSRKGRSKSLVGQLLGTVADAVDDATYSMVESAPSPSPHRSASLPWRASKHTAAPFRLVAPSGKRTSTQPPPRRYTCAASPPLPFRAHRGARGGRRSLGGDGARHSRG